MALPSPLPDALVDLIAHRFRVLGEPTRIRLLDALREGAATVSELQAATGASQQNVSKHLGVLLDAGMVRRTKDGNRSYYSIADETLFDLCEQVCGSVRRQVAQLDALLLQVEGEATR
ncbi:MAG TPA: metalloregulator ArsR/SmtB family transcription factor [Acidimicrobiales bacterium]|nr:metalloregulator ArsR/SmtB family transcription factor [Acidimicrobiales bacterium]